MENKFIIERKRYLKIVAVIICLELIASTYVSITTYPYNDINFVILQKLDIIVTIDKTLLLTLWVIDLILYAMKVIKIGLVLWAIIEKNYQKSSKIMMVNTIINICMPLLLFFVPFGNILINNVNVSSNYELDPDIDPFKKYILMQFMPYIIEYLRIGAIIDFFRRICISLLSLCISSIILIPSLISGLRNIRDIINLTEFKILHIGLICLLLPILWVIIGIILLIDYDISIIVLLLLATFYFIDSYFVIKDKVIKYIKVICIDIGLIVVISYIMERYGFVPEVNIIGLIEGYYYSKVIFQDILLFISIKIEENRKENNTENYDKYEFFRSLGINISSKIALLSECQN